MADWKRVLTAEGDIATHQNDKITLAQLFAGIEAGGATAGANQILKANGAHSALVWADDSGGIALSDLSVGAEASASGNGGISYANGTGVFTYTPPDYDKYQYWTFGADATESGVSAGALQVSTLETFTLEGGTGISTERGSQKVVITNDDPCDEPHVKSVLAGLNNTDTLNIGDTGNDCTVNIRGNLTVAGTTTTINTTNLNVADKLVVLADGSADGPAASGAGVRIDLGNTTAEMPDIIWTDNVGQGNTDGSGTGNGLTGWSISGHLTSNQANHYISIMDYKLTAGAPSNNSAGVGSLCLNVNDDHLYIRTA